MSNGISMGVDARDIRKFVTQCLFAGLVPYIKGSPGMGKSSIVRSIAEELNLKMIDHRLSTSEPTDLTGLPFFREGRAEFMPFRELFPIQGDEVPEGKDGWLLFLDEFPSASRAVQAAAYKLILDRMVGQHPLHERVVIVAAGNLDSDRAMVNKMSTAMQSRMVHVEMKVNFDTWLQDVAIPNNYDSRIIGFLSQWPSKLMDFKPDHAENTFCCPRTWEFMNKLVKGKEIKEEDVPLYAGTITSGVAAEFLQFSRIYKTMTSFDDIIADPEGTPIPNDAGHRWALTSILSERMTLANAGQVWKFMSRMTVDFRVLHFRSAQIRMPEINKTKEYQTAVKDLAAYLNGR